MNLSDIQDLIDQTTLWTDAMLKNPYDVWGMEILYDWDSGNRKMPACAPDGTPASIVKVHAATGSKLVMYAARRTGDLPLIPTREADTPNQVFKWERHRNLTAKLGADGNVLTFTFSGWYFYELLVPVSPAVGDSLQFGQPPYFNGDATKNLLTPAQLGSGITAGGEQFGRLAGYDQNGNTVGNSQLGRQG